MLDPLALAREGFEVTAMLVDGARVYARIDAGEIQEGVTAHDVVHRDGPVRLLHFRPRVDRPFSIPVLIVYAIFNRWYMLDLQEDRSFVRNLLDLGLDVYVADWGYPGQADRWTTLEDYVDGYVDDLVDVVRGRAGAERVNLVGICQGGTASLCYAALHPEKVQNLVTMVTPVDFHAEGSVVAAWARGADVDPIVDALGTIPGELVALGFLTRSPFQRNLRKYVEVLDFVDDEERLRSFLRMERWIFDTPDVPGEAYRQWMNDLYRDNKLVKGELELGDRRVELGALTMPVLNVLAEHDDVVPAESALALERYVGTEDYTVRTFPVGHIGMYVSRRVQHDLPPTLAGWLRERG